MSGGSKKCAIVNLLMILSKITVSLKTSLIRPWTRRFWLEGKTRASNGFQLLQGWRWLRCRLRWKDKNLLYLMNINVFTLAMGTSAHFRSGSKESSTTLAPTSPSMALMQISLDPPRIRSIFVPQSITRILIPSRWDSVTRPSGNNHPNLFHLPHSHFSDVQFNYKGQKKLRGEER